jgi:hypothetical protein
MDEIALRMYVLVPYNLSPIQQGIQAMHAGLEYAHSYGHTDLFKQFITNHKTVILLNGGTTRERDVRGNEDNSVGTMQEYLYTLGNTTRGLHIATFYEPDLNYTLTAFCFICDERVWNYELYPEMEDNPNIIPSQYNKLVREYSQSLGGKDNLAIRLFLKGKRLA